MASCAHDAAAREENGELVSWREHWEELVDDFLYASRCGELDEVKTALFDLENHLASPHGCFGDVCRDTQTHTEEKDAPKDELKGATEMPIREGTQQTECPCQAMRRRQGPRTVDVADPVTGQTALHMAAANGNEEIAKFLIYEAGALHLPNRMGNTPLHWAVSNQKVGLVKLLLDASSPPDSSVSTCNSRPPCPPCVSEDSHETYRPFSKPTEQHANPQSPLCVDKSPSNGETAPASVDHEESSKREVRLGVPWCKGVARDQERSGQYSRFAVDVLAQNKMGKSALSEGFNASNPQILQMLLEHHSAKQLEEAYQSSASAAPPSCEAVGGVDEAGEDTSKPPSMKTSGVRAECRGRRGMLKQDEPDQLGQDDIEMGARSEDDRACAAESVIAQEVVHALRFGAPTGLGKAAERSKTVEEPRDNQVGSQMGNLDTGLGAGTRRLYTARAVSGCDEKRELGMEETGVSIHQDPDEVEEMESSKKESGEVTVKCREVGLAWCGEAFGRDAERDDTTGLHLWSAAVIAGYWMATLARKGVFAKADVLELGAGCGVMGLSAALHSSPPLASLTQTDVFPHTLRNLRKCQELNGLQQAAEGKTGQFTESQTQLSAKVMLLDWSDSTTWPGRPAAEGFQRFDFLLGSDLIYDVEMVEPLVNVVATLLKRTGTFYYVHRLKRHGAERLTDALRRRGFKSEERSPPEEYLRSPFVDKPLAQAELLLPELFKERDFVMVKCAWR